METKKEFEGILEEIEQEFDRRINTQLKIMAGLGDDIYRYGYGKSLEAYQQGKLFVIDIIRKRMNDGWIPADERLPEDNNYILLSFENFALPMIGRYKQDAEGGAFYIGNEEETCIRQDLYVNAWMHLPEPYRPEALTGLTCSTAGIMSAGLV